MARDRDARIRQIRRDRAAAQAVPPAPIVRKRNPTGDSVMRPGARLQSAIELLIEIETTRAAADDIVGGFFRRHRFAGSKDRGAISEHIYAVLRQRASLDWWLTRLGGDIAGFTAPHRARRRLFAAVLIVQGWQVGELEEACDGDRFRPEAFNEMEARLVAGLAGKSLQHPDMPDPIRYNYPDWLDSRLRALFGDSLSTEMEALGGSAALDLRVNRLKTTRAEALSALRREEVELRPTRYAALGLRVKGRVPLATLETFKKGWVEVQDEGSQLAAALAAAKPGMRVVDFCAGAGGKTLALAADMDNRGHLIACDVSSTRLERSAQRLRRAGVSNVERRVLTSERDKWVKRHAGGFDRVFVDAPCTGTGTWRRNPDAKWRLLPNDLVELTALQQSILDSAARLVRPRGRLIYATCSLLPDENEDQVAAFIARNPAFELLPITQVWGELFETPCPVEGDMLRLSPARHETDGFFTAVLQRRADAVVEIDAGETDTDETDTVEVDPVEDDAA